MINFQNISKGQIILCILTMLLCAGTIISTYYMNRPSYTYQIFHEKSLLELQSAKNTLIDEVDGYIKQIAPNSTLNGIAIVEACDEYNIDVRFVLAQGHVESCFGTKGVAAKTNSVFNVYAYDGVSYNKIHVNGKYSHPDHSIRPYLDLLNNRYLVDGKTEFDMFTNYVDADGHRYASAKDYEKKLFNVYNTIDSTTNISAAISKYKKYKTINER